jgi:hypothetical protein
MGRASQPVCLLPSWESPADARRKRRQLWKPDDSRRWGRQNRSYLASEENFQVLKDLETRNLVVPVVGDFGGTKALRAVAQYLKSVDAKVSAFYVSNVEQFLSLGSTWDNFCHSVRSMPIDETSMFIRSGRGGPYTMTSTGNNVHKLFAARMLPELRCTEEQ